MQKRKKKLVVHSLQGGGRAAAGAGWVHVPVSHDACENYSCHCQVVARGSCCSCRVLHSSVRMRYRPRTCTRSWLLRPGREILSNHMNRLCICRAACGQSSVGVDDTATTLQRSTGSAAGNPRNQPQWIAIPANLLSFFASRHSVDRPRVALHLTPIQVRQPSTGTCHASRARIA